jgi:hypothetical protein
MFFVQENVDTEKTPLPSPAPGARLLQPPPPIAQVRPIPLDDVSSEPREIRSTIGSNPSSNPLQRACSGFLIAACVFKSCSETRL